MVLDPNPARDKNYEFNKQNIYFYGQESGKNFNFIKIK